MSNTKEQHPDFLRDPEKATLPDPRTNMVMMPYDLVGQHGRVKDLILHDEVPLKIQIQFETTKNIYLYAWFVYRFYPVARHHALTVLELALRERYENVIPLKSEYRGRDGRLYLKSLLRYCKDEDILKDDKFESARRTAEYRARHRNIIETIKTMEQEGLTEMSIDDAELEILDVDRDFDYVGNLVENLPKIRNEHAHGSTMLDNHALGTLRTVSEIINQLW